MIETDELLAGLNAEQRAAVETVDGPVLIVAGPGSGKTRVLTHRIAYLLRERGVPPYAILAVTFTNKAAKEMKERLVALVGHQYVGQGNGFYTHGLAVGTFHAFCVSVLRHDGHYLGLERSFTIADTDDQLTVVKRALKLLDLDPKQHSPRGILSRISGAKSVRATPEEFRNQAETYADEIVARVYPEYQRELQRNQCLDFDDLLNRVVDLFEYYPEVLRRYQERFRYILVDEYQDTNHVQYNLIHQLAAGPRANLCVVGDEDQSIYRFRGADVTNIRNFKRDYPEATTIFLEQNYRSTQPILEAAMGVIKENPERTPKQLRAVQGAGPKVVVHECFDERHEAQWVAREIARLQVLQRYRYKDFAVMYRTNAQSRVLEQEFDRARIPLQLIGGIRFHERAEVRDVMALLRVVVNPADTISLRRVIGSELPLGKGVGPKALEGLEAWAVETGLPLTTGLDALLEAEEGMPRYVPPRVGGRSKTALLEFARTLGGLRRSAAALTLAEFFREALDRAGVTRHYEETAQLERLENVQELANEIGNWPDQRPIAGLTAYLEEKALISDADTLEDDTDKVTLITLHAAKGLEYEVVFLVGLEEGLLPHKRAIDSGDDREMEEERRLAYVGITRAKKLLYLTHAFRRTRFGQEETSDPSRFLLALPDGAVERQSQAPTISVGVAPRRATSDERRATNWGARPARGGARPAASGADSAPAAAEPTALGGFQPGDRVLHDKFGQGRVVNVKNLSDDQDVTIRFNDGQVRTLSANFARIRKR
ncbi:MAG TPA: UvrD-helicase domain-containing protein [Thermomicrobiales bacterium]|nr:UvrD-helicase domain-containing protein [Thermomicrobiales bacterium]